MNAEIRQPHEICCIEHTWLFCLFSGYFCILLYLVLNGTFKSVCVCMEVGGGGGVHAFPSDHALNYSLKKPDFFRFRVFFRASSLQNEVGDPPFFLHF